MGLNLLDYDILYLSIAFALARKGYFTTSPNPNVGCVIVQGNQIVGRGYHFYAGGCHAEIYALREAGNLAYNSTVYVTLEPCSHYGKTPPCVFALIRARVKRVVISMLDPNPNVRGMGLYYLRKYGIKVRHSIMLSDAELLNKGFLKRMRTGLPYVRVKLATSLDGRVGMRSGKSKWITSVQSRQDVQKFRAKSDVILSTAVTIIVDNPMLNVRWSFLPEKIRNIYPRNKIRQPMRVIIDSMNRVRPEHQVIQSSGGRVLLVCFERDVLNWPQSVKHILLPSVRYKGRDYLDLLEVMKELGRYEVNNILVEAGATLFNSLLNVGLVDELILYQANKFLGSDAQPLCLLSDMCFSEVISFKLLSLKRFGPDIRLRLKPSENL